MPPDVQLWKSRLPPRPNTCTSRSAHYKSVKIFFKKELGVTYEYVRQLGKKLGRLNLLLEEGQGNAGTTITVNPIGTQTEINVPLAEEETPTAETPATQQPEVQTVPEENLSFSIAEKVQTVFGFALSCAKHLSPQEKDEYYSKLIDRLQDELQTAIDQTGFRVHGNRKALIAAKVEARKTTKAEKLDVSEAVARPNDPLSDPAYQEYLEAPLA